MKNPAVLFYTSDFMSGVSDLTMEERGQYITMLCIQHQKGELSEKTIRLNVGLVSDDVMSKFIKDENGNFYNKRMREETEKRNKFTESRLNNGVRGGRPKKNKEEETKQNHMDNQEDIHMHNHMGNGNENENINKKENGIVKKTNENIQKATEVLSYLNQQANRGFKPKETTTLKLIIARLKDGHEQQTLFDIIDMKCYEWLNDAKMSEYLRPDTLFNQTKFDNYLEQLTRAKSNPQQFKNNADARTGKQADGLSEMQRYKQQLINDLSE